MRYYTQIFLPLIVFVWTTTTFAQTTITGKVVGAQTKTPIEDANVALYDANRKGVIVSFTVSDAKGDYLLSFDGKAQQIIVSVSGFNLKTQAKTINNTSQTLNFEMIQEEIVINKVIVKAPKIRQSGDTLSYNVAHFTSGEDRSIADVLKKMPGIQVRNDGTILYQNRPINKFYIEDLDLLKGRYGIATNNINVEDVATVQVMENHQPIKALIGKEYVSEAAINLRLKSSAKGAFFLKAQAGLGAKPLLLSNELLAMYFARNMQHLSIYKSDNTGRDVTQELQSLYSKSNEDISVRELIEPTIQPSPSIPQQRYLFNDAHTLTINNLNKLGKHYTLTSNINYAYDEIDRNGYSLSEYFVPQSDVVSIEETTHSKWLNNNLNATFTLDANQENYFFNNNLRVSARWNKIQSNILANNKLMTQQLRSPTYSLTNFFDLVKNKGKHTYKAQSFTGYKTINQAFRVAPSPLREIIGTDGTSTTIQ